MAEERKDGFPCPKNDGCEILIRRKNNAMSKQVVWKGSGSEKVGSREVGFSIIILQLLLLYEV